MQNSVQEYWLKLLKREGILWTYDYRGGNNNSEKQPHVLLELGRSGKHADGFFFTHKITANPALLQTACHELLRHGFLNNIRPIPQWIISPGSKAATIAHEIGRRVRCYAGYTEESNGKIVIKDFKIKPNDQVLIVSNIFTPQGIISKTISTLEELGAKVNPQIGVLANCYAKDTYEGRKIIALVNLPIRTYFSSNCPLCKRGSPAIHPQKNWDRFLACNH